jgi:peptidoglycan/LPS O-acetylase OafA/YrhL
MSAIGFAKQHFNINSPLRKLANEAIYPFYLLHQPLIVVTGYLTIQLDIAVIWKVVIVLLSSFALTTAIYWVIIRPHNLFRVIFGMKKLEKSRFDTQPTQVLVPVIVKDEACLSA